MTSFFQKGTLTLVRSIETKLKAAHETFNYQRSPDSVSSIFSEWEKHALVVMINYYKTM